MDTHRPNCVVGGLFIARFLGEGQKSPITAIGKILKGSMVKKQEEACLQE